MQLSVPYPEPGARRATICHRERQQVLFAMPMRHDKEMFLKCVSSDSSSVSDQTHHRVSKIYVNPVYLWTGAAQR